MKRGIIILALLLSWPTVRGAVLSPESFGGAAWGAVIGGLSGADCHNNWSNDGAWIGAGIGLLTGTLIGESRRQQYYNAPYAYPSAPGYGYAPPAVPPASAVYPPAQGRPSYKLGGTLVGAAAGAMIGEGVSDKPWQGAAIGAAAGLVMGSIADRSARSHGAAYVNTAPSQPQATATASSVWQTPIRPRHQIPDAPLVPDAPSF
jgi:hypothetical protein